MRAQQELVAAIAEVGRRRKNPPPARHIDAFAHFFHGEDLDRARLDERDGGCTRRELLLRMLLLTAVLDQGPDLEGVREMMLEVVNDLYRREIRIFHRPLDWFQAINISVEQIWDKHEIVKTRRAAKWAADNRTTPGKYNLYMDASKQTLNYAVFRWGVPLALPHLLGKSQNAPATALVDYLETHASAENMCTQLKGNEKFGLGKAIGDKACHLFAKWMVSTFRLSRKQNDSNWGEFSYELPFDSNAGRVLWRCGYFSALADEQEYVKQEVIQHAKGKGGKHYIRVTNMRGMKVSKEVPPGLRSTYIDICTGHLKSHVRAPKKVEVQRFQHALLRQCGSEKFSVAEFDDGLIEIGRNYCFNHEKPRCDACPVRAHCAAAKGKKSLIDDYRT